MSFGRAAKQRLKAMIWPTFFLMLAAYFIWQGTQGDRGIITQRLRETQLGEMRGDLARVEADRDAWEHRVSGLRGPLLDPDLLDERARAMLNLADPNEIVVPYGPGNRLF